MDYYGLFPKFKFNRVLKKDELEYHLKQCDATDINGLNVIPDGKVISLNSNYLEMVDKYYSAKGFLSLVAAVGFFGMMVSYFFMLINSLPLIEREFSGPIVGPIFNGFNLYSG